MYRGSLKLRGVEKKQEEGMFISEVQLEVMESPKQELNIILY